MNCEMKQDEITFYYTELSLAKILDYFTIYNLMVMFHI